MRKQIGWYDPESKSFCYVYEKLHDSTYDKYTVPVFADDGGVNPQILLQVLKNQDFVLGRLNDVFNCVRTRVYETGPVRLPVSGCDLLRKKTRDLLEKEGYEP